MQDKHWKELEPLADLAYEQAEEFLTSPALSTFKDELRRVMVALPESFSVSLDVNLVVFDSKREASLPLSQRSLCVIGKGEPYLADGDNTSHRYVVNGEVCQVPHDRCPNCWH